MDNECIIVIFRFDGVQDVAQYAYGPYSYESVYEAQDKLDLANDQSSEIVDLRTEQ